MFTYTRESCALLVSMDIFSCPIEKGVAVCLKLLSDSGMETVKDRQTNYKDTKERRPEYKERKTKK